MTTLSTSQMLNGMSAMSSKRDFNSSAASITLPDFNASRTLLYPPELCCKPPHRTCASDSGNSPDSNTCFQKSLLTTSGFAGEVTTFVYVLLSMDGCEISFCPRRIVPSTSSAARFTRSFSTCEMHGTMSVSSGMRLTREYKKMAASIDRKKSLAPAKKKFPMDPLTKSNRSLMGLDVTS